ncbi:putative 115 kDa protein [Stylophora pistillata]|uniref:Putative 115 kDa protein n=1 Tax=Stylophora pistillata TaxID=50429 RepID=A0A2B4R8Q0_STYPI|nr:putative 115 kDa protein [Stylophora pistillata]
MIGHQDFQFRNLEILEVETALESINPRKSTGWDGVPPKAFKLGARELSGPLTAVYNSCITLGEWPAVWKKGEWTPVFKKEDPHEKKNYRPITVQVTINKIFEQLLSKQLNYSFNDKLCDKLTAYRKNHSCETALLAMTENWKISLDEHKVVGVLSTDMSKAFDSLYYPLTLAKLKAYGIRGNSLKLLDSYFTDRYNRVKLGSTVSEWERGSRGCPQGSAFGPLIWNMFQNDLTYSVNSNSNINMYADDHQFHAAGSNVTEVHDKLIASAELASRWYRSNFLKGNYDKYQTMTLGNKNNDMDSIIIDDNEVKSTKCLKLLGVYIDNRLQFDEHIANICKRSSQRVGVLMRLRNMIPTDTKLKLFKAAILPYLTYSHLVWHFCRASDTRKLERIQERALRAVYCDKGSSYDKLLDMANLSTLQNRRLQDIAILMYKYSFKKCAISNAMDGTEDDLIWDEPAEEEDEPEMNDEEDMYDDRLTENQWNELFGHSDEEDFDGF